MAAFLFSEALNAFCRSVSLIWGTKNLEESKQNPKFIFLFYCLTLWPAPCACDKLSLKWDKAKQTAPSTVQLEKRDIQYYQYGLAVCELPFYEICSSNVTRIKCAELGCCYHKETCYKKAVPEYMKTFVALIVIILVVFVIFVVIICFPSKTEKIPTTEEEDKSESESDTSESTAEYGLEEEEEDEQNASENS